MAGRRNLAALALLAPVALVTASCAGHSTAAKYPPRRPGCKVAVFHRPVPEVAEWDDIGVARVDCHIDVGRIQCMQRLRAEACRMGGDILYDVPERPIRPTDQGVVFRGRVAHSRAGQVPVKGDDEAPPATSSGPVEPLVVPSDGGQKNHDASPSP
jgi:hypothetical protein